MSMAQGSLRRMSRWLSFVVGLGATLGTGSQARAADGDVENGKVVYDKQCAQCHGKEGDADGPGALYMLPRPRVFKDNGAYKFRTTASGAMPTDQDLFNIITIGIPGSAMPGFSVLGEQDRWDLVAFIKSLNADFADPDYAEDIVTLDELVDPKPIASSPESLEKGKALYEEAKCAQCHGENGRGNGSSFNDLKDNWGTPILPANLANPETFRGGAKPADIFRSITTGLDGTPMPSYRDSPPLDDIENRWHLVNYVLSLGPQPKEQRDEKITAAWVESLPTTADDEGWDAAPVARFQTISNIVEPPRLFWPSVEYVMVQALYSDDELALRIEWDDRTNSTGTNVGHAYEMGDTKVYNDTDHPDQFAVQFPAKNEEKVRPYFMLGDKKRPVSLWWWQADTGKTNVRIAKGFSSIAEGEGTDVVAEVSYNDGRYTMVVRRVLTTEDDSKEPQFAAGDFVPVVFNAWDGSRGEVGQRRALTTWYWLHLTPPIPRSAYVWPVVAFFLTLGLLLLIVRRVRRRA